MASLKAEHVVFGSSLASLVLAERLGASRQGVVLLNPGRAWGGIFAGLPIGARIFDAGMTNFEFDLFADPCENIQTYDPDRRADAARFVGLVRAYIDRFAKVHAVPTPKMICGGTRYRDLMITNEFDVLRSLADELQVQIRRELDSIVGNPNPLHPRHKGHPGSDFAQHSFEAISIANHGETLHRMFIEPLFCKVLGVASREVPGPFHRSGWAPLFYPETLLSQFGTAPQKLKPTVFHYPDDTHFGVFIRRILETVRATPNVRVFEGVSDTRIDPSNRRLRTGQGEFEFGHLAWGGDLRQLAAALADMAPSGSTTFPNPPRASLDLFFLQVKQEGLATPLEVLIDPEPASPFYRITDQTACGLREESTHQLILECNSKVWNTAPGGKDAKIAAALERYAIDPATVVQISHRHFADALSVPSLEQMRKFDSCREAVRCALPGITLLGPSSGYVSVTLNDQIVQALKCAQRWECPL